MVRVQGKIIVNGAGFRKAMTNRNLEVKVVARQCSLSEQTVRNYMKSTSQNPHRADLQNLELVAQSLSCDVESLILGHSSEACTQHFHDFAVQWGISDASASRYPSLAGRWHLTMSLDETFQELRPWNMQCDLEFQQECGINGPMAAVAFRIQMNDDRHHGYGLFDGCLTESGNVLQGCYQWIEDAFIPKQGHVMAFVFGDCIKRAIHWP